MRSALASPPPPFEPGLPPAARPPLMGYLSLFGLTVFEGFFLSGSLLNIDWLSYVGAAILTGIGTVRADNPQLNVRLVETRRQPLRVLVDSRLEVDPGARVFEGEGNVLVATAVSAPARGGLRRWVSAGSCHGSAASSSDATSGRTW